MKRRTKIKIFAGIVVLLLIVGAVITLKSPLGDKLVKDYISKKVYLAKLFNVTAFDYEWNSFSMRLQKGDNVVFLFGNIFPFDATFEAKLNDISQLNPNLAGKINSQGEIKHKTYTDIKGNALFAEGFGSYRLECVKTCVGVFNGNGFDTGELLKMVKINFPYIRGKNTLSLVFSRKGTKLHSKFKGDFEYNDIKIKDLTLLADGEIYSSKDYDVNVKIFSKKVKGDVKIKRTKINLLLSGNLKLNLDLFRSVTLYPVKGIDDVNFSYSRLGDVFKFGSNQYTGYANKNEINVQLDAMSYKKFFSYLGLVPIFKGVVNGNVSLGKNEGTFNLVVNDISFIDKKWVGYVEKRIRHKVQKGTLFLKGTFNDKKITFNALLNTPDLIASIRDGVMYYDGSFHFKINVTYKNEAKYVFYVTDKKIKLIYEDNSYKTRQNILFE